MKTHENTAVKSLPTIPSWLKRGIPALDWLAHDERKHVPGDALAGMIVATLLIPQAMAFALLAGLPPPVSILCQANLNPNPNDQKRRAADRVRRSPRPALTIPTHRNAPADHREENHENSN